MSTRPSSVVSLCLHVCTHVPASVFTSLGAVFVCLQLLCLHATSSRGSGVMPRSAIGLHVNSTGDLMSASDVLWHACPIPTGALGHNEPALGPIPHLVYSLDRSDIVQRCLCFLVCAFFLLFFGGGSAAACCCLSLFRRCYCPVM